MRLNFRNLPPALFDKIGIPHLKPLLETVVIDEYQGGHLGPMTMAGQRFRATRLCFALLLGAVIPLRAAETDNIAGVATLTDALVMPPPPGTAFVPTENSDAGTPSHAGPIHLPSLEEELHLHGGSHLYEPSDVGNELYAPADHHAAPLRLPEDWHAPQPLSFPADFLGSELIRWNPDWKWPGCGGTQWEPRFVGYGSYELFGTFYEQNGERRDGIGHQLVLDFDLALTGTERAHVQFRPLGEDNSGGSFWQLNDPQQYIDNSDGVPQRWWIEGEIESIFGALIGNEMLQLDLNVTAGKFPFVLHNGLLMNDEIVGIVVGKNTITSTSLSNLNLQAFYALGDVEAFPRAGDLAGVHVSGDYRHAFIEMTYARVDRGTGTASLPIILPAV